MDDKNDALRRANEWDAVQAFYGEDVAEMGNTSSSKADGPWRIRISTGVVLELYLPLNYPSKAPPTPLIHASVLSESQVDQLVKEMITVLWTEDEECAILWAEHLRSILDSANNNEDDYQIRPNQEGDAEGGEAYDSRKVEVTLDGKSVEKDGLLTFLPNTSKYGQPIRQFEEAVVQNDNNRRTIYRGKPLHPPKSGPSESLIAHVASVESMDHVNWVLAELLLNDKKVAKASHNMIAYRFWDSNRGCLVSDNDDDGEKGAGSKLAALLEMTNAQNVIVVVSRWFGGVLLGPSRFKYIASAAREALEETGFLKKKK